MCWVVNLGLICCHFYLTSRTGGWFSLQSHWNKTRQTGEFSSFEWCSVNQSRTVWRWRGIPSQTGSWCCSLFPSFLGKKQIRCSSRLRGSSARRELSLSFWELRYVRYTWFSGSVCPDSTFIVFYIKVFPFATPISNKWRYKSCFMLRILRELLWILWELYTSHLLGIKHSNYMNDPNYPFKIKLFAQSL